MQSVVISKNQAGQRFDKFLQKYLPNASKSFLYKMLRKKNIILNGRRAEGNEILSENDEVVTFFSDDTFALFSEKDPVKEKAKKEEYAKAYRTLKGIEILYEDEDIIVLNKPAGILSQKAKEEDLSLNEWLIGYLSANDKAYEASKWSFKPSVCNRLDINTSGIVLCGKTLPGLQFLSEIIKEKKLKKFYRTVCVGKVSQNMTLSGYLEKDEEKNKVSVFKDPGAKDPEGIFSAIQTELFPVMSGEDYSYLEVLLVTGKTHQIRAHLADIGHPVVGDAKYGDEAANVFFKREFGLTHQLLHAYRVEFPQILQEKFQKRFSHMRNMVINAALPAYFDKILQEVIDSGEKN